MLKLLSFAFLGLLTVSGAAEFQTLVKTNSVDGVQVGWAKPPYTLAVDKGQTSDGDGSIHFGRHSETRKGNKYMSIFLPLGKQVDLRGKRLLVDAKSVAGETTGAFYVRAYNNGESKPCWSFNSWGGQLKEDWRTFSLQNSLCLQGLAWEKGMVEERIADKVDRLEFIIGTSEDDVDFGAFVDNIRIAEKMGSIDELQTYKPIVQETPLVRDGKPLAVILHPDSPAGRKAATALVQNIERKTGVTLVARPGTVADQELKQTAILLGNVFTNPAMQLLYARRLTPADKVCPGAGGTLIHTVFNPFGKGANAIVLAASDDAGLGKAAAEFAVCLEKLANGPALELPRLFERFYSKAFLKQYSWADDPNDEKRLAAGLKEGQRVLDRGIHCSIAGTLQRVALRYQLTGNSVEAKLYVALWEMYAKSAVADPRKFGGPWGFDSDFPSHQVVSGWDNVEEDPALSESDRLKTLKHLVKWFNEAVVSSCAGAVGEDRLPHNHQTFPTLGTLYAGLYFSQGFPQLAEGGFWLDMADQIFQRQATYFKPYEDCNGYQWLTNGHLFRYSLVRPNNLIFENGNGRKIIDFLIGNMDNLAIQVPYGDTGSWKCWTSELVSLDIFSFATGDPDAYWAAKLKRDTYGHKTAVYNFSNSLDAPTPTRFDGVKVWPLEPKFYDTFREIHRPPMENCFDKISFREKMAPEAAYLLLDGLGTGGHKHYDGNSIPRITQFNRIWLADNDYFKSPIKFHNSMMIFKDGQSSKMPSYTELLGAGESESYGFSRTKVSKYASCDWDRSIVWLKEKDAFLVLDRLTARAPDEYQFRLLWHGVGETEFDQTGMLLRQKGPSMRIQIAPGPEINLYNDKELGTNWNGYPHADSIVRSMSAIATVKLEADESYLFATVIHGKADGDEPLWDLEFIENGDAVRLTAEGETSVFVLDPAGQKFGGKLLKTDAKLLAGGDALALLGAKTATLGGEELLRETTAVAREFSTVSTAKTVSSFKPRAPRKNLETAGDAPALRTRWKLRPSAKFSLLTGNTKMVGASLHKPQLDVVPPPLKHNVFNSASANLVASLLDGSWAGVGSCTMFPMDETVTLTLDFDSEIALEKVSWKQWWAETSSKKTAYKLAKAELFASNDGFANDKRRIGGFDETKNHPSWGDPVHYEIAGSLQKAKSLRLVLTPQAGTAIYLAEVFVHGTAKGEKNTQGYTITKLASGNGELAVATGQGALLALDSQTGATLRDCFFPAKINDVAAVDLDNDGNLEWVIGRRDYWLTTLKSDFSEIWSRQLEFYRKPPSVNLVFPANLDGDAIPEIVCGAENWRFYAFDASGKELWNYEAVHPSRSGAAADLDGDGKDEVICGTHYYTASVLNGEGLPIWKSRFGPICWSVASGSFAGDKTRGVVFGSGDAGVYYHDAKGKRLMSYNTGDEVKMVATLDFDGDGKDEFAAASLSHSVYAFNAAGKRIWRTDIGAPVTQLAVLAHAGKSLLVAGTDSGLVVVLDERGKIMANSRFNSGIATLLTVGDKLFVATGAGEIHSLAMP